MATRKRTTAAVPPKKSKTAKRAGSDSNGKRSGSDRKAMAALVQMADSVVDMAERSRAPHIDVPSRSLGNVKYNKSKRFIEMGTGTNRRELFNLSQAKSYMQTVLVGSGCTQLIEQEKSTSIRGLYYLLKHTIAGTKEVTFVDQQECDPIIEDVEVGMNVLREELHLYAQKKGDMVGEITLIDGRTAPDPYRLVCKACFTVFPAYKAGIPQYLIDAARGDLLKEQDRLVAETLTEMERFPPIGEMPVLDEEQRLVGVLNLKDILKAGIV